MSAPEEIDREELLHVGQQLHGQGYAIVPILRNKKYPGYKGWQNTVANAKLIEKWASSDRFGGWGVLAEHVGGLDADIYDDKIAKLIYEKVSEGLPGAPARGGSLPKVLYVCSNPEQLVKVSSNSYEDPDGNINKVEFLGKGQQFVTYGIHPDTKKFYRYPDKPLHEITPSDLPEVTPEIIQSIVDEFEALAEARVADGDWKHKTEGNAVLDNVVPISTFENLVKASSPTSISFEQQIEDLRLLDAGCNMQAWVEVGMALYHQYQGGDDGLDIWDEWSSQSADKYMPGECEKRWRSFKPDESRTPLTFATIHQRAEVLRQKNNIQKKTADLSKRQVFRMSSLKGPVPETEWFLDGLIPLAETTLLYADGGTGKSIFALQLAVCAATGMDFLGRGTRKGATLYMSCEDSPEDLHKRSAQIGSLYMLDHETVDDVIITTPGESFDNLLMTFSHEHGETTPLYLWLDKLCETHKVSLLIIDTAADTFGGNENIRPQVRQFIQAITSIARKHNLAALVSAHPSAAGLANSRGDGGSTAWNNSVRSRLYLSKDDPEQPEDPRLTLYHKKCNKGKRQPDIPLMNATGVIQEISAEEVAEIEQTVVARTQFIELLRIVIDRGDRVSTARNGGRFAPRGFVNMQVHYADRMQELTLEQYTFAMEALLAEDVIEVREDNRNKASYLTFKGEETAHE